MRADAAAEPEPRRPAANPHVTPPLPTAGPATVPTAVRTASTEEEDSAAAFANAMATVRGGGGGGLGSGGGGRGLGRGAARFHHPGRGRGAARAAQRAVWREARVVPVAQNPRLGTLGLLTLLLRLLRHRVPSRPHRTRFAADHRRAAATRLRRHRRHRRLLLRPLLSRAPPAHLAASRRLGLASTCCSGHR